MMLYTIAKFRDSSFSQSEVKVGRSSFAPAPKKINQKQKKSKKSTLSSVKQAQ